MHTESRSQPTPATRPADRTLVGIGLVLAAYAVALACGAPIWS
ncbi:MAG: hypothetical protein ACKOTB_17400 [Planctomycetia bacterium]